MQDRFKFRAVLKTDDFCIVMPIDSIHESYYMINTYKAKEIFDKKYPQNCFFSEFLEIIEKQKYINQYSFDCDLLITNDFTNLMQSTGLKDKNQNPIYEGDIVELDNIKARGAIEWDNFYCEWRLDPKIFASRALQGLSYPCQLTIIGNIYENPELLKAEV